MRKAFFITIFSIFSLLATAQNTIHVKNNITFTSSIDVSYLLGLHKEKNENTDEIKGYRIQIASNNDRSKIYSLRSQVYSKFADIKNYLVYDQPYYKLRVGDFKTRLAARRYLDRVIKDFPSAFIVLDDIKAR